MSVVPISPSLGVSGVSRKYLKVTSLLRINQRHHLFFVFEETRSTIEKARAVRAPRVSLWGRARGARERAFSPRRPAARRDDTHTVQCAELRSHTRVSLVWTQPQAVGRVEPRLSQARERPPGFRELTFLFIYSPPRACLSRCRGAGPSATQNS